jgi:hypothetical protein
MLRRFDEVGEFDRRNTLGERFDLSIDGVNLVASRRIPVGGGWLL